MSNDAIAGALRNALQQCHGFDGDSIASNRKDALDYYFQRVNRDKTAGRADVESGDVSAMVEATLAQMVESLSSDRVCDFDPMDSDDEDQAQLESEAVQYFVMGKENGFLELLTAIKEALLMRNGLICVTAEDRTERRVKNFTNVDETAAAELISQDGVIESRYDEDQFELQLIIERRTREFKMESIPMDNFLVHAEWHKPTLDGCPLCAIRHVGTRAELLAMGISETLVEQLKPYKAGTRTEEKARDPKDIEKNTLPVDESQELVEWYTVYTRRQAGASDELRKVIFSYQEVLILKDDPISFINLAAGTAIINPHRFTGISLFDKLKQSQDIRTQLKCALLDNVNATTLHRLAGLDGVVNEDDVTSGRVNGMIRVKNLVGDVRQAVMPLAVPDTSANILQNLESTARERSEMGGAALDMQSAQMQIGGEGMGSMGLDRAYSVAEQLSAAMMKTLSATLIRSVFLLAHRTLREYFDGEVPVKRNGKWTYLDPSSWPERHNVTVKPGMSPGERARRIQSMNEVLNGQLMMADRGMDEVLVDMDGYYRALMDRDRLAEVQNPEQYYVDPASERSKRALAIKQQQGEQDKMDRAKLMQQAAGMEQMAQALDKYKHDSDLQFKYFAELLGVEWKQAEMLGGVAADLVRGRANGTGQPEQDSGEGEAGQDPQG